MKYALGYNKYGLLVKKFIIIKPLLKDDYAELSIYDFLWLGLPYDSDLVWVLRKV